VELKIYKNLDYSIGYLLKRSYHDLDWKEDITPKSFGGHVKTFVKTEIDVSTEWRFKYFQVVLICTRKAVA
jgi:hypothetical protein